MIAQLERRDDIRVAPTTADATGIVLCPDRLDPVPPDTEHDGWACTGPPGHGGDHRAEDGTRW